MPLLPYSTRRPLAAATSLAILAGACADRDRTSADPELERDLALVGEMDRPLSLVTPGDTSLQVTTPRELPPPERVVRAPTPVPRATESRPAPQRVESPVVSQPAPEPVTAPEPAPVRPTFAAGSSMTFALDTTVCTTSKPGDKIIATALEPLAGRDGAFIPAGTRVVLEVSSVATGEKAADARIEFRLRTIPVGDERHPVEAMIATLDTMQVRREQKGSDAKKVVGGAIAGAVIGQILGKDTKSTVIGATTGAAAGTIIAASGATYEACLAPRSRVRLTLMQPLVLAER